MSLLRRINTNQPKNKIVIIGECAVLADGQSLLALIQKDTSLRLVGTFETGQQGIDKMREIAADVIIVDMVLPDMDGLTAAAIIRGTLPQAKLIIASLSNAPLMQAGIIKSPDYFLVKPVPGGEFLNILHKIVQSPIGVPNQPPAGASAGTGGEHQAAKTSTMLKRRFNITDGPSSSYADLKARVQNKLLAELDPQVKPDAGKLEALRVHIKELFNTILAEENMVLSRVERNRLFESIVAEVLGTPSSVSFSCYSPKEVTAEQRAGLYVYAHLQRDDIVQQVEQDAEKFRDELGGSLPKARVAKQTAQIETGMLIKVVPECDDIEFDPPELTKKWQGDWTRFGFDFRVSPDQVNDTLFVRVSIQVAEIEIAHIKCAIEVVERLEKPITTNVRLTPLPQKHENLAVNTASPYQRIFISYSRKDSKVAQLYKTAQVALGNEVFLDVDSLRAGENWKTALAKAIDSADIFQLFWSEHSASSEFCHYEWDYALRHKCPDTRCEEFIRPVYWQQPMPGPPSELEHLNFKYAPFVNETTT